MSYGSDYRDRRRRNRRSDQRLVIYAIRSIVTTAALVAIAFAFDVPEKIREKLRPRAPEKVVARSESAAEASERPPAGEPTGTSASPRRRPAPLRPDVEVESRSTGQTKSELAVSPERPSRPSASPAEVEPIDRAVDKDEHIGQRVKLKLDKRRMNIPLAELSAGDTYAKRVRVIALRKLEEKFELAPTDGWVTTDADLQILFPDHPRARILIRTVKSGKRMSLVVEPQMALWADQPMPYTLKKIKSEAFKTRRAAEEFLASLDANRAELPWLKNQLGTARNIPLDEFHRGKRREKELENLIKQMEGRVDEVTQGVQEVDALEGLAKVLHGQATLQFQVTDSH